MSCGLQHVILSILLWDIKSERITAQRVMELSHPYSWNALTFLQSKSSYVSVYFRITVTAYVRACVSFCFELLSQPILFIVLASKQLKTVLPVMYF